MKFDNLKPAFIRHRSMTERNFTDAWFLMGVDGNGKIQAVFEARFYCTASGNTIYCAVWFRFPDQWGSATGDASGYGYDRLSACVDAGVDMEGADDQFGGAGMDHAMKVLARELGEYLGMDLQPIHAHA